MNKICTSIEQSKKLIELGIDINTADMCYRYKWYNNNFILLPCAENAREPITEDIPAWSLVALEKLMPFQLIENNNRYGFYQVKGFNKQGETYRFGYKSNDNSFLFETSWSNNLIDAAFEMICWLKENNKI